MLRQLLRRFMLAFSVVVAVSFAAFVLFDLSFDPTGPLAAIPGPVHVRDIHVVRTHYHLDDPVLEQYARWVASLPRHGFGTTVSLAVGGSPAHLLRPGDAIGPRLWHSAGVTAQLVGGALMLVLAFSALVGTFTARRRQLRFDIAVRGVAYLGAAVPTFLVADLLLRAIGGTSGRSGWFLAGATSGGLADWFRHMTLPIVALAAGLIGLYSRHIRTSMLDVLKEPYIATARAKGLPERTVVVRHALRNAWVPVVAALSLELGGVIGASLAADAVFGIGGLGASFLQALGQADPFQLTALVVTTAGVACVFMFVGDTIVAALDPRVRGAGA